MASTLKADKPTGVPGHSKIPTAGLVAYYPFNGNANDASSNGFDCTPHGAVLTSDRFHRADSAYSFNGVDAYIECSNDPRLGVHQGVNMTASMFIKPTRVTELQQAQTILSKYIHFVPEDSDFYVAVDLHVDQTIPTEVYATGEGFDVVTGPPPQ